MRLDGATRLAAKLNAAPARARLETADALDDAGEDLKRRSKAVAPFRDGDLRAAAFSEVSRTPGGSSLEVGYEGPPGYLIPQHAGYWENHMGYRGHVDIERYTTPGSGPHFLSRPYLENKERYKRDIADAVKQSFRRSS